MLFRLVVMVSVAATALALAACAEQGEAMAAGMAAQAAEIAATQATIATTQAIHDLAASTTRMASGARVGGPRGLPFPLPPVRKGTIMIFTPELIILQKNGKRLIVHRENLQAEDNQYNESLR
jgi:hypothetical protein